MTGVSIRGRNQGTDTQEKAREGTGIYKSRQPSTSQAKRPQKKPLLATS